MNALHFIPASESVFPKLLNCVTECLGIGNSYIDLSFCNNVSAE